MKDSDIELICYAALDVNKLFKTIASFFKEEDQQLLKHIAASSIHLAIFSRELCAFASNKKIPIPSEIEKKFLSECGCGFEKALKNNE